MIEQCVLFDISLIQTENVFIVHVPDWIFVNRAYSFDSDK